MLRKRIIFTLIYSDGFFCQSRNFRLQKVGDINWLEENYGFSATSFSLDELVVLNASRKNKNIEIFSKVVERLSKGVYIPISAGGGIRDMKDVDVLFKNGADKIVLNTILTLNKSLVVEIVEKFGSQSVIASVDYSKNTVFIENGTIKVDESLEEYIQNIQNLGVGEIYLNSIDRDGTGFGFDFNALEEISANISIPLIISGGAGNGMHLMDGLNLENVSAVSTANLFNFVGDGLIESRKDILLKSDLIASWEI